MINIPPKWIVRHFKRITRRSHFAELAISVALIISGLGLVFLYKMIYLEIVKGPKKAIYGQPPLPRTIKNGGAKEDRTPDLVNAIHALYQLSYGPNGAALCK